MLGAADAGTEDPLQGLTAGIGVGDELVKLNPEFFEMMKSRFSSNGGRLYGTTNPDSPYHWLKTDYLDNQKMLDAGELWHESFTLDDNLSLSRAVRARYDNMYKGVFKKRYIDGEWVLAEGAIYKDSFDDDNLYDDSSRPFKLFDPNVGGSHYVAIDYGTSNACVFLHIIDAGDSIWVERERYYDSRNFDETAGQAIDR